MKSHFYYVFLFFSLVCIQDSLFAKKKIKRGQRAKKKTLKKRMVFASNNIGLKEPLIKPVLFDLPSDFIVNYILLKEGFSWNIWVVTDGLTKVREEMDKEFANMLRDLSEKGVTETELIKELWQKKYKKYFIEALKDSIIFQTQIHQKNIHKDELISFANQRIKNLEKIVNSLD